MTFYVDGVAVHRSNLPSSAGGRGTASQSTQQQQQQQQSGPILIGGRLKEETGDGSPRKSDGEDAAGKLFG